MIPRLTVNFAVTEAVAVRDGSGGWAILCNEALAPNDRAFYAQMLESHLRRAAAQEAAYQKAAEAAAGGERGDQPAPARPPQVLVYIGAMWNVATLARGAAITSVADDAHGA